MLNENRKIGEKGAPLSAETTSADSLSSTSEMKDKFDNSRIGDRAVHQAYYSQWDYAYYG